MPVEDTRAVARLPRLDIEICHRKLPEEGAELLAVSLRATPDLGTSAAWLDPLGLARSGRLLAAWTAFNPWFAWWRLAGALAPRPLPGREEG